MNGPHDLGGQHGLGKVNPEAEAEEPVFHDDWERRAFAVTVACGFLGQWNIDEGRYARERQHPVDYLRNTYYENWMSGLETLLVEKGMVTAGELETGKATGPATGYKVPDIEGAKKILATGGPTRMADDIVPAFEIADQVRVTNNHPLTHTRAPRYVRGRIGTIARLHGVHVFADANAQGHRDGAPLYSVRFEPRELWGDSATGRDPVYVDLWEPYLEAT
ncbi:MAG: nitrile hydratase subunit beta [Rhodospirillaceae bacterium]|jgi:nitrile hydratase subunit beta|nr:nitrile hydratase subunit beta [Rhodospirillaceae bacterium]